MKVVGKHWREIVQVLKPRPRQAVPGIRIDRICWVDPRRLEVPRS